MSDSNRSERPEDLGRSLALLISIALCCLITGILTYAWIDNSSGDGERADYYQDDAQRNQEAICIGREGALLAECLVEQRAAARQAQQAEQDLNAQRNMALWAMWLLIVSIVTTVVTVWALWYVRGTLVLTREAVEDTGDATKAMIRQNEISEAAQRPWLKVEAVVSRAELQGGTLILQAKIKVTNIGKIAAERCSIRLCTFNDNIPTHPKKVLKTREAAEKFSRQGGQDYQPYFLLPEESVTLAVQNEASGSFRQIDVGGAKQRLHIIAFVAVRYFVPGSDEIRTSDKGFCFTYGKTQDERDDPFALLGIPYPIPDDLSCETVIAPNGGYNLVK